MTTDTDTPESGVLPGRLEVVREPDYFDVPSDPDWQRFSDRFRTFSAGPNPGYDAQEAATTPDPADHFRGPEDPGATVEYDLQQALVTENFEDPDDTTAGSTTLTVESSDAGDTNIDVIVSNNDGTQTETITTDGSDGTTQVSGSETFASIGLVELGSTATGDITISDGSGTTFGTVPSSETKVYDVDPNDPAADGILRDELNQLRNSHLVVYRREHAGGNDSAGIREYTVIRGAKVASAEATNDPTASQPILMSLEYEPRKVRSYLIHQPSASTGLEVSSTDDSDTMDITVEDEGAGTTETVSLNGTTTVPITGPFTDIDAVWLSDNPTGDITVTDGSGTTIVEIQGGLSQSDDGQPVDGDRGIPPLGSGSHASEIGTSYEHFIGDRLERPAGSGIRPRVSSANWTVENDFGDEQTHVSKLPVIDEGNRTVSMGTDVAGPQVSHENFVDALTKSQQTIEHELDSSLVWLNNTVPSDIDERQVNEDEGIVVYSVTWTASGTPAVEVGEP